MKERAPDRRTSCAHYGCLPETLIACDGGGAYQTTGEMEWRWLNGETVGGSERSSFRPHHVCHFGVQTGCGNSILYQLTVELRYTDSAQVASCINTPSLVEGVEMHHSSTTDSSCCGPAAVGRTVFTPSGAGIIQPSVGEGTLSGNLRVARWNAHTESLKVADGPSPSPATSGGKRPGKPDACYQCGKRSEGENPMCGGFMRVLPRSTRSKPLRRRRTSRGEGAG